MEGEKAYRYGWVCGRVMLILAMAFVVCELCAGCGRFDISYGGGKLVYDACDDSMLPGDLTAIIGRKKQKPLNTPHPNNTYTYIVVAAGMQERDDVGVELEEMYKDDNAVYVKTLLRQTATPSDGVRGDGVSFPYTVIRIMKMDLPVVFK